MREIHEHLPVFLSPFFLSASVHFKCQPVRTARYLLVPIHKLDSNLRSVSIWKSALSHRVSLSRMPKHVPDHTLCPWCLHAWEVQTPAIWTQFLNTGSEYYSFKMLKSPPDTRALFCKYSFPICTLLFWYLLDLHVALLIGCQVFTWSNVAK